MPLPRFRPHRWLLPLCFLAISLPATALSVPAAPNFSGTFLGEGEEKLVLDQKGAKVSGQVHVGGMKGSLSGRAAGTKLTGKVVLPWGDTAPFTATLKAGALHFQITGDPTVGVYRRAPEKTAGWRAVSSKAEVGAAPSRRPTGDDPEKRGPHGREPNDLRVVPKLAGGTGPTLSARGAKAGGQSYRSEYQGWGLRLAPGWSGKEQDGMLVLGHSTEAGMIAVLATEERDLRRLRAGLATDLAEVGLLGPVPALKRSKMPAGTGVWAEFPVTSSEGGALKVRVAGVVGKRGTVAVIGTTTGTHFPRLRLRVDAMARSIAFFRPKVAAGARFIAGEWYSFTSVGAFTGGSGGTEARLAFCPDGSFVDSSESSYGGQLSGGGAWGVAGGPRGSRGKWRAEGGPAAGKVQISYPDGRQRTIPYQQKAGSDGMYFDGRLYGKTGGGKVCR